MSDGGKNEPLIGGSKIAIEPYCEAYIQPCPTGCIIFFARVPSSEVVEDLYSMESEPGIVIVPISKIGEIRIGHSMFHVEMDDEAPCIVYGVSLTPVYHPAKVAAAIYEHLTTVHGFSSIAIGPGVLLPFVDAPPTVEFVNSEK